MATPSTAQTTHRRLADRSVTAACASETKTSKRFTTLFQWGLPSTSTEDWGLGTGDWGLGTGDWGLGTGDWGLRLGTGGLGTGTRNETLICFVIFAPGPESPVPSPQLPVPRSQSWPIGQE